ncbi:conserved membrane hypothetical protein [uncultured Mycobacterium sp.]|uniref:Uncharacterized protein n=1 Tax=uncultured Mycobacterium sp. TaxID=171292 RepID=A0A1Y5PNJ4_9MYCO|nr:conserved membrane hypothetical protein [uncultured Mycobacterium sp.]
MMGRIQFWLMRHPRVARPLRVMGWLQLLSCIAVGTAPDAAASTNAVVLNWTGLRDSYGVPVGDFYLSLASLRDQLTQTGPDAAVYDPSTWFPWMLHGMMVLFDNLTAANILTAEIGGFVGIIALAMWVMRLTISTYWLTVLGELAHTITSAVIGVTTRWGLVALTVPIGVFIGALAIRRGERGRGATMIMLALLMPALAVTVFSDPAGMMYGPNGMLQFGRRMAFSTAQVATHGGAISGGGFTGQVDMLTSSLITHVVREPLEVFNFGHVVDRVGGCGAAVSAAWQQGASDGPIKALAQCGDTAAVNYAQHLDGTNVVGGFILLLSAFLFGWFMVSAGASVFMVSVKALYTTAKLLPSVLAGGIDGAAREHAKSTVWKFFKHPLEAMVFITFVSVIGLAIERLISRPLPAELGGANPFAHVLMMGGASMAALYLLRHIRADLQGTHPGRGILGRGADVALGLGMHAALGGAGRAALGGAKGLRGLVGSGGDTPWDRLDKQSAANPQEVLGPAQEGFDPVPGEDGSAAGGGAPSAPGAEPGDGSGTSAVSGPDPTGQSLNPAVNPQFPGGLSQGRSRQPQLQPRRPGGGQRPVVQQPTLDLGGAPWLGSTPQEVNPIDSAGQHTAGWAGSDPLASYIDHHADIPIPLEPPPDLDAWSPPPPDDDGRSAATVDPITDR